MDLNFFRNQHSYRQTLTYRSFKSMTASVNSLNGEWPYTLTWDWETLLWNESLIILIYRYRYLLNKSVKPITGLFLVKTQAPMQLEKWHNPALGTILESWMAKSQCHIQCSGQFIINICFSEPILSDKRIFGMPPYFDPNRWNV